MQGVLGSWIVSPHCKGSELPSTDPLNRAIASVREPVTPNSGDHSLEILLEASVAVRGEAGVVHMSTNRYRPSAY